MRELEFKSWMYSEKINEKVISDIISRVKRLERALDNIDFDIEYTNNKCSKILTFFDNSGKNTYCESFSNAKILPIGKSHLSTYKYSFKKYLCFLESLDNNN